MNKIKVVGIFIFTLSIILAILSAYISKQNKINNDFLNTINVQKSFTQEISKTIFYLYKNQNSSYTGLDKSIKKFTLIMDEENKKILEITNEKIIEQNKKIILLWNDFYLHVQKFRDQNKVTATYSSILLERTVNTIYNKNIRLIIELDKLIEIDKAHVYLSIETYRSIQYILFLILVLLLIYLFTQVKVIISFIQKFLHTSENIITNSSIKDLEHIRINNKSLDVSEATNNFNVLVDNINTSIEVSTHLLENSAKSLEQIENNIEDLLELLSVMDENKKIDKNLAKKEDAIIQSLEELSTSSQNLKALKVNLNNLKY